MTAGTELPTGHPRRRVHQGRAAPGPARPHPVREALPKGAAEPVERVRAALSDVAAGRPVVLVGDDGHGDLVVAAELATPRLVSFLVRHTSGFLCVAVPEEDADRLDLPPMARSWQERPATAQCVAVDARTGIGTGISAADRARTIRLLAAPQTLPPDLVRPGHVVPLRVRADGVLASRGRGEAAADLAGLAGLHPAAALAAVVGTTDATDLARGPELADFAREHGLRLLSIGDLATYRVQFERLVERGAEAVMPLPAGTFTAVGFRGRVDGREHLALVRGEIADGADVLVRVHRECPLGDLLGSTACGCGARLRAALAAVAEQGRGIVVYLRSGRQQVAALGEAHGCGASPAVEDQLHDAAVGAQILRELGVRSARSLTGPHPWCAAAQP